MYNISFQVTSKMKRILFVLITKSHMKLPNERGEIKIDNKSLRLRKNLKFGEILGLFRNVITLNEYNTSCNSSPIALTYCQFKSKNVSDLNYIYSMISHHQIIILILR